MPTKNNFAGKQQNYDKSNGEYESGPKGAIPADADGDGVAHENKQNFTSFEKKNSFEEINDKRMGKQKEKTSFDKKTSQEDDDSVLDFDKLIEKHSGDIDKVVDEVKNKYGREYDFTGLDHVLNHKVGKESKIDKLAKQVGVTLIEDGGKPAFKDDKGNKSWFANYDLLQNKLQEMAEKQQPQQPRYTAKEVNGKGYIYDKEFSDKVPSNTEKDFETAQKSVERLNRLNQEQEQDNSFDEINNKRLGNQPKKTDINGKQIDNAEIEKEAQEILKSGDRYTYMMLDRLRSDLDYSLGSVAESRKSHPEWFVGSEDKKRDFNSLWYNGDPFKQIELMKKLHNSLKEKPEWLSLDKINEYENKVKEYLK